MVPALSQILAGAGGLDRVVNAEVEVGAAVAVAFIEFEDSFHQVEGPWQVGQCLDRIRFGNDPTEPRGAGDIEVGHVFYRTRAKGNLEGVTAVAQGCRQMLVALQQSHAVVMGAIV